MSKSKEKTKKERSRSKSLDKNEKKTYKKNYIIIPFDDSKLEQIKSIDTYIKSIKVNDPEEVLEKNDIDYNAAKKYLDSLKSSEKKEKFLGQYSKYQFLLNYNDRQYFQKYIKSLESDKIEINDIIKKNFIDCPIKDILQKIGLDIIDFTYKDGFYDSKKINISNVHEIFTKNNVFFDSEFDFKIPLKKGNFEIQYYSLLNDIWYYFDLENNKSNELSLIDLIDLFNYY
jgi:hypothetical protein